MEIAHTRNRQGKQQELSDHSQQVADNAASFAMPFGGEKLAYLAGILHDIGKFNPAFQHYLLEAEKNPQAHLRGPDHKGAGACLARTLGMNDLSFLVAGHHGGLPAKKELQEWLREREADPAVHEAIGRAQNALLALQPVTPLALPSYVRTELEEELFLRMLFSALVDADYLDTERHFNVDKAEARDGFLRLADLRPSFEANQRELTGKARDRVNGVRDEVYRACLNAALLPRGFFRLTVPTGGGKTRSSLAFALKHTQQHNLRRIIYAIPFTSITDQTAGEFRKIFGERAILEHHSAVALKDQDKPTEQEIQAQLAAENWDASLIVTTTVQLFESLMARSTSACRKLHNIAGSVIILDEVQTLPTNLLAPILDVLSQLVAHYQVTVVLCTATQPALETVAPAGFAELENIREIVPNPAHLFAGLKRVEYSWSPDGEVWSWERVSATMREERQALAIVNTRKDAMALLAALDDPEALHLSTWMCGAHRKRVLAEARVRLQGGVPCRLVSTQVIEAGVDVSFPLVLRALGPLDSIVQAAGRCNRNGELPVPGRVIVFEPEDGGMPPGSYRIGTGETRRIMRMDGFDFHDPAVYRCYFERYYDKVDPDEKKIQPLRRAFDYPEVAAAFQMIGEDTLPAIVERYEEGGGVQPASGLLEKLLKDPGHRRERFRALQPYMVSLRRSEMVRAEKRGLAEVVTEMPGLYVWRGEYDPVRGIDPNGYIDAAHLVV